MSEDDKPRINPGYVLAQLAKALSNASEHSATRIKQWLQVLSGLRNETLRIGSRTPVANTPPWITLEVVHGGFATGAFAAGGPLQAHEREQLTRIAVPPNTAERRALNLHYLGSGRTELDRMLTDGRFRIHVPEEGALLVAAWLVRRGESQRASALIEQLMPFFDQLRFYPVPTDRAVRARIGVCLQPVERSVASLSGLRPRIALRRMKESIEVWTPMYDTAVALFLETVEGETPTLARSASGELERRDNGQPVVVGGWPCRRYADDWQLRARHLLERYQVARASHRLCGKPEKRKENFALLRGYLAKCTNDPSSLTSADVGMIRKIVASFVARRGAPGSPQLVELRQAQHRNAATPVYPQLAQVLIERLQPFAQDEGVTDLDAIRGPLTSNEASKIGARAGDMLPAPLVTKAIRCVEASIETLVDQGIVRSSEVMARLLPELAAQVRASAVADHELRRLYEATYVAFRRRRSLLLLGLESQVKLSELPWVAALEPWVAANDSLRAGARTTLSRVVTLALRAFPQTIFPNKLVEELRALAAAAQLRVALVDELAADIFTGAFSENYLRAGQSAARLLRGTLYERYYGLPYDRLLQLDDVQKSRSGASFSRGFAAMCEELAGPFAPNASTVVRNGSIIEQAQILTTHNLAVLAQELDLTSSLPLEQMARATFEWICRRHQMKITNGRSRLRMVKNTAYAWRQLIFYLSQLRPHAHNAFLDWGDVFIAKQRAGFRNRFAPLLTGLRVVAAGECFGSDGVHAASGGRRFLGWSVGKHWLLA
jgi:hypothetical protein